MLTLVAVFVIMFISGLFLCYYPNEGRYKIDLRHILNSMNEMYKKVVCHVYAISIKEERKYKKNRK